MPVTIVVNKMTPSHKGSNGTSIAFPDVCKTPTPAGPIPIPYPNVAMSKDLIKGSTTVKMDGQSISVKGSKFSMSTGDEAGSAMGVASNKIKGQLEFANYSFDIKVNGKNVARLLDPAQQNMNSLNTFGPAHIQGPLVVAIPQLQGCEKTKEKQKEQKGDESTTWEKAGIWDGHKAAIQRVVDEFKVIIYFRSTNESCAKNGWIPGKHKPKPHEVIAAKTISGKNVALLQRWMYSEIYDAEFESDVYGAKGASIWKAPPMLPHPAQATKLFGVVMSLEDHNKGEPLTGYGSDSNGYTYKGKWITGDYDLMDIMYVGDKCERPDQNAESQFGRIKRALNKAMGWDGIQHGPQSQWVAKKSKGDYSDFSIPQLLGEWVGSPPGTPPPKVPIAEGRELPACDNELAVVAPNGTVIFLESDDDVKNALICCGCHR